MFVMTKITFNKLRISLRTSHFYIYLIRGLKVSYKRGPPFNKKSVPLSHHESNRETVQDEALKARKIHVKVEDREIKDCPSQAKLIRKF